MVRVESSFLSHNKHETVETWCIDNNKENIAKAFVELLISIARKTRSSLNGRYFSSMEKKKREHLSRILKMLSPVFPDRCVLF